MSDVRKALEEAITIAEEASRIALSYFRQAILIELKENQTPVTIADKKTEEYMRAAIRARFSEHGIVGEEFGDELTDSEFVWTIDPIDGTRSFIRGIPLFGTLLGLLRKGQPILGVMVLPALGETYAAARGIGATCNGHSIHVSTTKTLEEAVVAVGDVGAFEAINLQKYHLGLLKKAGLVRGYTDCFGHALVMRGAVDAMIDPVVSLWDIAPLACIIKEAGGEYCNMSGEESIQGPSFVTLTPGLKNQLLSL